MDTVPIILDYVLQYLGLPQNHEYINQNGVAIQTSELIAHRTNKFISETGH